MDSNGGQDAVGDDDSTRSDGELGTRERLLDAAIHESGAEGPERVTLRSVAARAGVAHNMVRFHFGTREAMLTAAFARAAHRDATEANLLAPNLADFAGDFVKTISEDPARQLLQYDFLLRAARQKGPMEPVNRLYDHYVDQVSGTFANAGIVDPDGSLAALVFAALDGLVLQHFVYQSDSRTEGVLDRLRDVLTALGSAAGDADRDDDQA